MSNTINKNQYRDDISLIAQHGFHPLYLSYYAVFRGLNEDEIIKLLNQGFSHNLKKANYNRESLRFLQPQIKQLAHDIDDQKVRLNTGFKSYHQALNASKKMTTTQQAISFHELLGDWFDSDRDADDLMAIKASGEELLEDYPDNFWVKFELAWIDFHLLNNPQSAMENFTDVADQAIQEDSPLAELAMRYLALTHYILGDQHSALVSIQGAISLDTTDNDQYQYELARYHAASDDYDDSLKILKKLIKQSPLFFTQTQADPLYLGIQEIDGLLERFHTAKLEELKEECRENWIDKELVSKPLPEGFDATALFNEVYDKSEPLLSHQPYPLLRKKENIANKIQKNVRNHARSTAQRLALSNELEMAKIIKKWKNLRKLGARLIYIAAIMALATVFLFIGSEVFDLREKFSLGGLSWKELVPFMFGGIVITGGIGIYLMQFRTPKTKSLIERKASLTELIERL